MSETFNTHQVWLTKTSGSLVVGGNVYYGVVNGDPVNVMGDRIKIFSDRNLGTELPNPIKTGQDGREVNKVWVGERHSIFVLDKFNVEQFQDLDRGETPGTGAPIVLSNVQGTNAITAEAPGGLTGYVDGQIYIFKTVATNTAIVAPWVTLAIAGAVEGAKPIKFNFNEEIKAGMFQATQNIEVMYNSSGSPTTDHFLWLNAGRGISILTDVTQASVNVILANGGPSTAGYVDKQIYSFKAAATTTGNVTLTLGTRPTVSVKTQGFEVPPGGIIANNVYKVTYNSTGPVFELNVFPGALLSALNTNGFPLNTSRFTVASAAATADIWASPGGNEVDFTGTATVTDFPDAPRAGASRILHCAGAVVFTNNANLFVQGGVNYTAAAGDVVEVHAISVSTFRLTILKANGRAVVDIFGARLLHMVEEIAAQTDAGTFTSGANRNRDLNVVRVSEIPGASLNTGSALITLPPGTYRIEASAPAFSVENHVVKFNSVSGTAVALDGTRETAPSGFQTRSFVYGTINPIVESTYRVQHQCQTTQNTNGLGTGNDSNISATNIFSECKIWKIR